MEELYAVEAFIKERGRGSRREFLVKWRGYEDDANLWLLATQLKIDMPIHFDTLEKRFNNKRVWNPCK